MNEEINQLFDKWLKILRLDNSWDIRLEMLNDEHFRKKGDIRIDCDDKKAIVMINTAIRKEENIEEVLVHELLHLKMYPLDQVTESLIISNYEEGSKEYNFAYIQFMHTLEVTVEELTKCFLKIYGDDQEVSFERCKLMKSFNELFDGLKNLE